MAKAKSDTKEEVEVSSKDLLGGLMKQYSADHFNLIRPKHRIISTGSLKLDTEVKIRSGCVVRLSGLGAELGKTSETLVLLANYMATMPKSKAIFFKAEGRLSEEMQKRSGLKFVHNAEEWEYGTVFVFSGNKFEVVATIIETLLKDMFEKGEYLAIAIDSLDGLTLRSDAEKDLWSGKESPKVAGVQLLTKHLFRRVALPITHYDALLVITSQYSAPISLDPYTQAGPRQVSGGGGSSAMHQSDYVFELGQRWKGDYILEDPNAKPDPVKNKTVGLWATYNIKKSGTDVTGATIKVPIKRGRVGCAIWIEMEVADMALAYGFVTKAGAWLTFASSIVADAAKEGVIIEPKIQGLNALYEYMENDRAVFEWLLKTFRKTLGLEESNNSGE